jgi:hypothetical protein
MPIKVTSHEEKHGNLYKQTQSLDLILEVSLPATDTCSIETSLTGYQSMLQAGESIKV